MNRRELFKGAFALFAVAALPAVIVEASAQGETLGLVMAAEHVRPELADLFLSSSVLWERVRTNGCTKPVPMRPFRELKRIRKYVAA